MYFDVNGDLDLTNDGVLGYAETNPFTETYASEFRIFENVAFPIDYGPGLGTRPFMLIPLLGTVTASAAQLQFMPEIQQRGEVTIGHEQFIVTLSQTQFISGRFDRFHTQVTLYPREKTSAEQKMRPIRPVGWRETWARCTGSTTK